MKKISRQDILNLPISELNTTVEFKAITQKYGYHTLTDLLKLEKPYNVLQHEGFNYRMLAEFTHLLADHGMEEYLS
jgi:hypothetical protein